MARAPRALGHDTLAEGVAARAHPRRGWPAVDPGRLYALPDDTPELDRGVLELFRRPGVRVVDSPGATPGDAIDAPA